MDKADSQIADFKLFSPKCNHGNLASLVRSDGPQTSIFDASMADQDAGTPLVMIAGEQ